MSAYFFTHFVRNIEGLTDFCESVIVIKKYVYHLMIAMRV